MPDIQPDTELHTSPVACDEVRLHAPAFWRPRFAVDGDMLRFAPFLFWLTAILRPKRTTVVGLGDGVSCFAFCQALERLSIDGSCTGINFLHKEMLDFSDAIKEHATQFYEGLVDLRHAEGPAGALSCLMPGSQDLLVIDLLQSGDWPEDALDDWCSRLSPRGCLVLHGLKQMPHAYAALSLSRQLSQLSCIEIEIGAGLIVLCNDSDFPADLAIPLSQGRLSKEVSTMFARLGQSLVADVRYDALTHRLDEQGAALAEAQRHAGILEAEIADLSVAFEARGRKTSQYQALCFDSDAELKALRRAKAENFNAQAERRMKDTALAERDALAIQLRQNRETHYRETAALSLLLEKQKMAAAQETAAFLSSTSWKLTSPLRRIRLKLSSKKYDG